MFMNEMELMELGEKTSKIIRELKKSDDKILTMVDFLIYCDAIKALENNDELYLVDLKEMEFKMELMGLSEVREKFEELTNGLETIND